jgi:NodT family efflux transporter outer membrane factor (OMF) lipoprotein
MAGPKVQPPPVLAGSYRAAALPGTTEGADAQRFLQGQDVPEQWWTAFGSPELTRRVVMALAHSPTVASAQAALLRAQEGVVAAGGSLYPTVDVAGGFQRVKNGPVLGSSGLTTYTVYSASLNVGYKLDLFGGTRHGIEAAQAAADVRQWLLVGTYLSLASNVTIATIQEGSLRAQVQAGDEVVGLLQEQTETARRQVEIGTRAQADLLALKAQVATAQATLPPLRKQLEAVRNQLAVYLGRFPAEADLATVPLDALTLPRDLPVSLPSRLVRQRPDVQAAESMLRGAAAQVGVATAQLLPQITLGGAVGPQSSSSQDLLRSGNLAWSLGLNLLQPVFHGGALRAQKRAAQAGLDQAVADYKATVLAAFANVADALDALQFDAQAESAQADGEQAAARSLELVKAQYRIGSASYLQLLDATRQWTQARTGLIRSRAARLSDTAALYAALGGGWAPGTR